MTNFFPVDREEEDLVKGIGDDRHQTGISEIEIEEGNKIRVLHGPLKNYEGNIVKINLHKREVTVGVKFMGRIVELYMAIEMVERDMV